MITQPIVMNFEVTADSHTLSAYRGRGGYRALDQAKTMKPESIRHEVLLANVQGRGGAGFPMGKKWEAIDFSMKGPIYLCANADEGEPGTFKDRWILEHAPHQLIESMLIAAHALHVRHAFIYIRGEFDLAYRRLTRAIEEAYDAQLLGDSLDIVVYRGAGSYVCGEASALLNSIEGKKGFPRNRPPRLSVKGLFASPTIVNNVETLSTLPFIIQNGGAAYAARPTRLFSISGHIQKPGVYERPLGYSFETFIFDDCGGIENGKALKALIPGGLSTRLLLPSDLVGLRMDIDSLKSKKSDLGSGGIIAIAEGTCMPTLLEIVLRFYHHESCGQCTPCREGVAWLHAIVRRMLRGEGTSDDLAQLSYLAKHIDGYTICAVGDSAAYMTESFITRFRDEFVYLIDHHRPLYQGQLLC